MTSDASEKKAYVFHVAGQLWAHADITVVATSEQEAEQYVRRQLNLRNSSLTNDLRESVGEQVRKEMGDDDFEIELTDTEDASDDYPDAEDDDDED